MILERLITNSQETKQANLRATNIIVVSFAAFFLSLRYLARWQQGTRIETDDFVIFAAFVGAYPLCMDIVAHVLRYCCLALWLLL